MAELNLSIEQLFRSTFGDRGEPLDGSQIVNVERPKEEFPDKPTIDNDENSEFVTLRNSLGTNLPDGTKLFMPIKIGDVLLPNEPTISFERSKEIVKTSLTGAKRNGTIKEFIGFNDYQIVIRGIALNYKSNKIYPEDIVRQLSGLEQQTTSLPIECALCSLLGIYRVVIERLVLPPMIGVQHAAAYEFTLVSDEDFILEID